jgi:hypothetical protein
MDKAVLEYIIKNGSSMPLSKLAEKVGYSVDHVRVALERHNVKRFRTYSEEHVNKVSKTRAISCKKRLDKIKVDNQTPWPKITTTMGEAMCGKSYGGNISLPGTKNPVSRSAVYSMNVGTFKSSMGW